MPQPRPRCPRCKGWLYVEMERDHLGVKRAAVWTCLPCGWVSGPDPLPLVTLRSEPRLGNGRGCGTERAT